ncbi:MAG: signal peptidase I [Planctomycetota bacterium]|jgi:signal peptidase I
MSQDKNGKSSLEKKTHKSKDRAAEIANTFEWLITAFILAFVFRAFVMEAFRIPTGSMADTLKGAHFRLCCPQCGYDYEYGFVPAQYRLREDTVPANKVPLAITRCPNCGRYPSRLSCSSSSCQYETIGSVKRGDVLSSRCPSCNRNLMAADVMPVANGDRILVLKCIYQFIEPKRWDVIVFKNPPEPTINYIKRLVGLPGEKVQIIDGDIYIDDKIARKPAKIQKELWMPVYNNDYQPVKPREGSFNGHIWAQPFKNVGDSKWVTTDSSSPTVFSLDNPAGQLDTIAYNTSIGNDFKATYAYDAVDTYRDMPICSDLMVRFDCKAADSQGSIGIALSKYEMTYRAEVLLSKGTLIVTRQEKGKESVELDRISIPMPRIDKQTHVKFANVDHQLIFEYSDTKWTHDLGRDLQDVGPIRDIEPRVEIFGSGKLTLSHIAIFRDIHYTEPPRYSTRATKDHPFVLEEDQFFVLGDNSPNSEDGRLWDRPGVANKGLADYREGTVPRDYLVGKALFVYWPSGFKPFEEFPFGIVPNVGRMRFIHGGSNGID